MTAFRFISLPLHGAVEFLTGLALMTGALAGGLDPAGTVLAFGLGAIAFGMAFGAVDGALAPTAHSSFDIMIAFAAVAAGLAVAIAGDTTAAILLTGFGLVQFALVSITRYTRR